MSLKWRIVLTVLIVGAVIIKIAPNFVNLENKWWPAEGKIVYGLDIQGGVHLVMGVDIETVMYEKLTRTSKLITEELKNAKINVKSVALRDPKSHELVIEMESPGEAGRVQDLIEKNHKGFLQILSSSGNQVVAKVYDTQVQEIHKQILDQAIGVIRNRIDEFGVAEPSISAQGDNRILVQLPGVKDSARAKELINRTAHLEFHIVSHELSTAGEGGVSKLEQIIRETETAGGYALGKDGMSYGAYIKRLNADAKPKLPAGTMIAFEKSPAAKTLESGKIPFLLKKDAGVSGDMLEDAFVSYGEHGDPQVSFRFGAEGAKQFGELTGNNIEQQLAIVLDEIVQSAPRINSRITDSGVITLGSRNNEEAFNEAKFISAALRAGALPAALEQLEERTVGPTLGADAISKAKLAGLVAFGGISIFMMFFYGFMGAIATVALGLNIICLLALLTGLGATLTLPGVAGIILTMGMAVDANVIIFERIKEEFKKGSSLKLAIADGFSHAYSAIIDSNLVGAAVALILFYYGTGPVRGFAVTLISGIVTSMFTAVFVSRVMMEAVGERIQLKRA
jgi:preprotein translocase subunit SecD